MTLTSTGNLAIVEKADGSYRLQDKTGSPISRVGAFAEVAVAKVRAGLVEEKWMIVDGVNLLKELMATVAAQQTEIDRLKAEVKELKH